MCHNALVIASRSRDPRLISPKRFLFLVHLLPPPFAPANAKVSEPAALARHVSHSTGPSRVICAIYCMHSSPDTVVRVQTEDRVFVSHDVPDPRNREDPREPSFPSPCMAIPPGERSSGSVAMRCIINTSILSVQLGGPGPRSHAVRTYMLVPFHAKHCLYIQIYQIGAGLNLANLNTLSIS